jgi:uroporphyrin-III C-methyltransferase
MIERATLPGQRSIVGTLQTLPELSVAHGVHPPALIMIGDTVALQARIGSPAGVFTGFPEASDTVPAQALACAA